MTVSANGIKAEGPKHRGKDRAVPRSLTRPVLVAFRVASRAKGTAGQTLATRSFCPRAVGPGPDLTTRPSVSRPSVDRPFDGEALAAVNPSSGAEARRGWAPACPKRPALAGRGARGTRYGVCGSSPSSELYQ